MEAQRPLGDSEVQCEDLESSGELYGRAEAMIGRRDRAKAPKLVASVFWDVNRCKDCKGMFGAGKRQARAVARWVQLFTSDRHSLDR